MSEAREDRNKKPEANHKDSSQMGQSGPPKGNEDDDLDFVVTEAHSESHELVGGFSTPASKNDDLGIQSNADIMDKEAHGTNLNPNIGSGFQGPIGQSTPPPPPEPDYAASSGRPGNSSKTDARKSSGIEKLSDDQLEEISRKMRGGPTKSDYLSEEEKYELIKRIDEASAAESGSDSDQSSKAGSGFDNSPIVPPRKMKKESSTPAPVQELDSAHAPKMSKRARGVAFFTKSFIQVTGEQILHEDDEMMINGRAYVLRKKRLSKKLLWGTLGPLAALLIFIIGAMFSSNADTGKGQIVGLVVDEFNNPILSGVEIRFPDVGERVQSNSQGFFKVSGLESGPHKVEVIVAGDVLATDYATVVEGEVTTLTMSPTAQVKTAAAATPSPPKQSISQAPPRQTQTKPAEPKQVASKPTRNSSSSSSKPSSAKSSTKTSSAKPAPSYSKLVLAANVENAKLSLDGSVMGAGNLTYSKLKPGTHKYKVSRDGYAAAEGTVELQAGKTKTLKVDLTPATTAEKKKTYLEKDYYYSGLDALQRGDLETAVSDFSEAIRLSPGYEEAYLKRAEAHEELRWKEEALADYVRAAEIFRFNKHYQEAINAYQKAIDIDNRAIEAYLGRGSMYLAKNQELAAVADFDMVVRLDKRDVRGYIGLGEARYAQGYFKKAADHFRDARSIDRRNPEIYLNLMHCYMALGDTDKLKDSYQDFEKYASEDDSKNFKKDSKYAGIMRLLENN